MSRRRKPKVKNGDTFGYWQIVSDPTWNENGDQTVKAKCLICGEIYSRYVYQFTSNGAKWGCKNCFQRKIAKGTLAKNGKKKCGTCQRTLDVSAFGEVNRAKDGLAGECKECRRTRQIRNTYKLDEVAYRRLLKKYNYGCAICGAKKGSKQHGLHIDHCHETEKIRGLLCSNCNTALGLFKDDINLLQNAIEYLIKISGEENAKTKTRRIA